MSSPTSPPAAAWYLVWLLCLLVALFVNPFLALLIYTAGAVGLYVSPHGRPFHRVVAWIHASFQTGLAQAQLLAFLIGVVLTLLGVPVARGVQHSFEVQQGLRQQRIIAERQQREAVARAERQAAQARIDAANAETERLRAQAALAKEQRRQADAAAALKRQQEREAAQKKADAERAARAAEAKKQAALREQQRQQAAAVWAQQARERDQERAQQAAAKEAQRQADEGPYTQEQAADMCHAEYASQRGVRDRDVVQAGRFLEVLSNQPQSTAFGDGHVWFWRPKFRLSGQDNADARTVLCRVYDDGRVEVVEP